MDLADHAFSAMSGYIYGVSQQQQALVFHADDSAHIVEAALALVNA